MPAEWSGHVKALLQKHSSLWEGKLGLIRSVEHRIGLKPGAVLVKQHPYKAGAKVRERVKGEIERVRSIDDIEPASEEWSSPVVLVPKPDGSERFCID